MYLLFRLNSLVVDEEPRIYFKMSIAFTQQHVTYGSDGMEIRHFSKMVVSHSQIALSNFFLPPLTFKTTLKFGTMKMNPNIGSVETSVPEQVPGYQSSDICVTQPKTPLS
jgi:hypothetical protein